MVKIDVFSSQNVITTINRMLLKRPVRYVRTSQISDINPVLYEAVAHLGGQSKMARLLNVTQQCISRWSMQGYVPVAYIRAVCHLTNLPAIDMVDPDIVAAMEILKRPSMLHLYEPIIYPPVPAPETV